MEEVSSLDLGVMFTQLGGGLALFLYGVFATSVWGYRSPTAAGAEGA